MQPRARGSASKIRRRQSRIKVLLTKYDVEETQNLESSLPVTETDNHDHEGHNHEGHNHTH